MKNRLSITYKKNNRFPLLLLLFCAFYVNEDVFVFGVIDSQTMVVIRYAVQFIMTFSLLYRFLTHYRSVNKTRFSSLEALILFCLLTMLLNNDIRTGYFFLCMILLDAYLLGEMYSFDDLNTFLYKSMYVVCVWSLIMFGIHMVYTPLLRVLPVIYNVNRYPVYFGFISNVPVHADGFLRNFGPFREPGVYQAFIVIPLIYVLFSGKKIPPRYPMVFLAAILTTFSTTGYIAVFFLLLGLVLTKKKALSKGQRRMIYTVLTVSICVLLYMTFYTDLMLKDSYGSVFGKLFGGYESLSGNARIASVVSNLMMILKKPLFGNGIEYVDKMYPVISSALFHMQINDNTNTLFILGAVYGIFFLALVIWRLTRGFLSNYHTGAGTALCILAAYFVLLFGEKFNYSIFIYVPMFWYKHENRLS